MNRGALLVTAMLAAGLGGGPRLVAHRSGSGGGRVVAAGTVPRTNRVRLSARTQQLRTMTHPGARLPTEDAEQHRKRLNRQKRERRARRA